MNTTDRYAKIREALEMEVSAMRELPRDLVLILRTEAKNQRTPPIDYVIAEDGGRMVHTPEPDIAMAELLEEAADKLEELATENEALINALREHVAALMNLTERGSEYSGRKIGGVYLADIPYCTQRIRERMGYRIEELKAKAALAEKDKEIEAAKHDIERQLNAIVEQDEKIAALETTLAEKDKEIAALRGALDDAADALDRALEDVEHWGAYAGEYFQDKHDLDGDLARISEQASAARRVLTGVKEDG